MKIIKFIFAFIFTLILLIAVGIFLLNNSTPHIRNKLTQSLAEKVISYYKLNIQLGSIALDHKNNLLLIENFQTKIPEASIFIDKIYIKYQLSINKINARFANPIINKSKIIADFNLDYGMKDFFKYNFFDLKMLQGENQGHCKFNFTTSELNISHCFMEFEKSKINATGLISRDFSKVLLNADFKNISLHSYKILKPFYNGYEEKFSLWETFIKQGKVSGILDINLSPPLSNANNKINAKLAIRDAAILYDKNFPIVQNINIDAAIDNKQINAAILQGSSNQLNITTGGVNFNWLDNPQDRLIKILTTVAGPSTSINDFLGIEQKKQLQEHGIDFSKSKGDLSAEVMLNIPLPAEKKTEMKINGSISKLRMKLLSNTIDLVSNIDFIVLSDAIAFKGAGFANNFKTSIEYKQDLPYTNSKFLANIILNDKIKNPYIKFQGTANLIFEYLNKGATTNLKLGGDLTKLGFEIKKFNIDKLPGKPCIANFKNNNNNDNYEFAITGSQDFNIVGSIDKVKKQQVIKIEKLKTPKMSFSGSIAFEKDNIFASIFGDYLDLQDYDLFQLLKKERSNNGLDLDMYFSKVMLKNAQQLKKLDIKMHCDKTKCYAGRIIATSKENFINAFLESDTDLETWRINAQNAGLFFKGLGLYDKIQNGAMSLTFSTKRDAVKSGQIFPITKGRLEINKFSINKSPFLTKIVSLTSLTGVLDFLTNSKDLKFDKLESDFTLHDNYVEISDLNIYGPFGPFDLFAKGNINLIDREILLKGYVVPSVYGINTMLKNTPVLGKLFAGKRSGIISAPFKIQQKY